MKLSGLLARRQQDLPGVSGVARVQRHPGDLLRRIRSGEIAVIDHADLDRRTAAALVSAGVVGVVNAAPSISGRFPNLGPEVLLAAGVVLIDGVGSAVLHQIRDGARVRLHDEVVFAGDREVGRGTRQDANSVADLLVEAKAGMSTQLEAFSANTIEFLRSERSLLLDGIGVPELSSSMQGRQALVVAPGYGSGDDLRRLRRYIRENRPVLVGVETGADELRVAGHRPDVIVGDPDLISTATLRCGADIVVPAHLDGHAPGLERIQDLGIGAVTFPATGNAEDLALLLADAHDASVVVTVGFQASLSEFLDRGRSGSNSSTFLTRLRLGGKLVDAAAVALLYRDRGSLSWIVLLVLLVLTVVLLLVPGLGGAVVTTLTGASADVLGYLRSWFS